MFMISTLCRSLRGKKNLKKIHSLTPRFPALFLFDSSDLTFIIKKKWPAIWARDQLSEWSSIVLEVRVVHCVDPPVLNATLQHTTLTSWRSTFFAWLISRKQQNDSLKIEWEDAQVFILFTFPCYSLLPIDFSEFHTKQGVRIRKTGCVCCRHVQRMKKKRRMTFFHELEKNKKWKFFFFSVLRIMGLFSLRNQSTRIFFNGRSHSVMYIEIGLQCPLNLLTILSISIYNEWSEI